MTTTYAAQTSTATYRQPAAAGTDFYATLANALQKPQRMTRRTDMVMTMERSTLTTGAVCDLLAAAGPLTARDIAGGLDVSFDAAAAHVGQLVATGDLREDEFGRYALAGNCASNAAY